MAKLDYIESAIRSLAEPIENVKIDPENVRVHSDKNIEAIRDSLKGFKQQKPIVVREDGTLVAGEGTLTAAVNLGWTHIAVVRTTLTGAQAKAFAIADNRTTDLSEFDDDALAIALEVLREDDSIDHLLAGFDDAEIDEVVRSVEPEVEIVEDEAPEPPSEPVTKLGDVWLLGKHRVLCGDATKAEDVSILLGDRKPFLMVTDPPYGVEYDPSGKDDQTGIRTANSKRGVVANDNIHDWTDSYKLFSGSVAYVWHGDRGGLGIDVGMNLRDSGFVLRCRIIWAKQQHSFGRGHYHWQHEAAWYAVREGSTAKWSGDFKQSTLWNISNKQPDHGVHGTQKPVECMARPIRNHGGSGDDVYDPFLGSGTTLIACEQLKRICYGIEIEPRYVDVICNRWAKLTGQTPTLEADGSPFPVDN